MFATELRVAAKTRNGHQHHENYVHENNQTNETINKNDWKHK